MIFKRLYDTKLAQSSYLLGCPATGEALVVDPNRSVDQYLRAAAEEGLRIAHVTETHIHADFVSGARELAHRSGGQLYLSAAGGEAWRYEYASQSGAVELDDGTRFNVGRIEIRTLHLPGHTPEHLTFLITDTETASEPMGALTGDFLFVGDVGRPDLLERAARMQGTMEEGARQLYRSIQRFREFPDYLQVWPGHGAGSACGKALGAVPQSTLGYEKRFNWAFGVARESDFVRAILEGQPEPPPYFAAMKRINRSGPRLLGALARPPRLSAEKLSTVLRQGGTVVDTREASDFGRQSVPGTINIPQNRSFTTWAGSLLPYDSDIYLMLDEPRAERIDELIRDLVGIGLDRVTGYFGMEVLDAWQHSEGELQQIPRVTLAQVTGTTKKGVTVLDVRGRGEWNAGHIPGAVNLPLAEINQRLQDIPPGALIVQCQSGGRAAIAASLLRARGFDRVELFSGGVAEWQAAGLPVESVPHHS